MKKSKMTEQEHETRSQFKKTSQHTRRPKTSSMNKDKKRDYKAYKLNIREQYTAPLDMALPISSYFDQQKACFR